MSTFFCQIFNFLSSNDEVKMHPAKKGINLVHCLAYIRIFCSKGVFFLQKSPLSTPKMADVLRIKCTKNDSPN